ncbi:YceI family protein [Pseudomarimonas salicorniae]|uniref:YceI family protein n=1 Tax=Pseudomarimonas salicorniae TaxID=2933270 RepID=A0ABT0GEA9_9GAMM|nr:YceI family protein [Lysobacter sp. CAU 1642]MCK7592881.1 YceI family protein [Lysobacter sp. CAU 1642]
MIRKSLLCTLIALGAASPALAETYVIDPGHTQVRFGYSHFGLSDIVGIFAGVTGEIVYDPTKPEASSVKATIPIADVHTGVAKMDEHLRTADFFDVATFPTASFTSSKVEVAGEGKLKVTGELKVRDISREVVLDVSLNAMKDHPMTQRASIGFNASTELKRTELGVGKYAPNVSDEVSIEITVEASVPKA